MIPLSKKALRSIEYALVIGGSFYLGMLIYPYTAGAPKEIRAVSTKEFAPFLYSATSKDFTLITGNNELTIKKADIGKWIKPYTRNYTGKDDVRIVYSEVERYLATIAPNFEREAVNAKLNFSGNRALAFVPSSPGKKLDLAGSADNIGMAMSEGKSTASLSFETIEPEITLEKINNLGIKELIAQGTSDYGKSPASRIHNIKVGMSKFNGIILKPGEEFSFNNILGTVEAADGYEAELVIKNGLLEKEYGGGICQVSTTVFRAAILAGFPIIERKPHSFPVQYYNPQGFDSTIYPGVVDLRFLNNTQNHVLIQTKVTGSKLSVEIYGTKDGREVTITGPVQYDKKPSGAMKAYFNRQISMNGETKEERFDSIYKAPPAHPLEKNPLE